MVRVATSGRNVSPTATVFVLLVTLMAPLPSSAKVQDRGVDVCGIFMTEWIEKDACGLYVRNVVEAAGHYYGGYEELAVDEPPAVEPFVTCLDWNDHLPGCSGVFMTTHGSGCGDLFAEWQITQYKAEQRILYYITDPEGPFYQRGEWLKVLGIGPNFGVGFTLDAIMFAHTFAVDPNAVVFAGACHSSQGGQWWPCVGDGTFGAVMCYVGEPGNLTICGDMSCMAEVLGCQNAGPYLPNVATAMERCPSGTMLTRVGNGLAQVDMTKACGNLMTFGAVNVSDGEMMFATHGWSQSVGFCVQGTDALADPVSAGWVTLARVAASHGSGDDKYYRVTGLPPSAYYRVCEVDLFGRGRDTEAIPASACGLKGIGTSRTAGVMRREKGGIGDAARIPGNAGSGVTAAGVAGGGRKGSVEARVMMGQGVPPGREECAECADVIAYTSPIGESLGFLTRFEALMDNYPDVKARYFVGEDESFGEAVRDMCDDVHNANVLYNQTYATDRFPTRYTERRPLLVVLGDADPLVVGHWMTEDAGERCGCNPGDACCVADRLVWDLDGTGWFGMVHRIPADELEELDRACVGAQEWNAGENVDESGGVIVTVGDAWTEGGQWYWEEYPGQLALEAANALGSWGYWPRVLLMESDFPTDHYPHPEKHSAFHAQLVEGAMLNWGFGLLTSSHHWPGWFAWFPDSLPSTPRQRLISIQGGCETVLDSVNPVYPMPMAEAWLFNDPSETMIVGTTGCLSPGWYHQHVEAQKLYLDGWLSCCGFEGRASYPLDWIAVYAVEEARAQHLDYLEHFFLSTETIGAYVITRPGGQCPPSCRGTESEGDAPSVRCSVTGTPSSTATFCVDVSADVDCRIDIYDIGGRLVSTLQDGQLARGKSFKTWLGRDLRGQPVSSGVYFARMQVSGGTARESDTVRFALVR